MQLIYYSIASDGAGRCERQWRRSVSSLRRHNRAVPVHLVLYGAAPDGLIQHARKHNVTVHLLGDHEVCFRTHPAARHPALTYYRTLHKFYSLRYLPLTAETRVLYADCDTVFFKDVSLLFLRYSRAQWYAREEPYTRRSTHAYDPRYLDEQQLAKIAKLEGLAFIPPYNTGICILNHGVGAALAQRSHNIIDYAWRFLLGVRTHPDCPPELAQMIRRGLNNHNDDAALPYPCANAWIVEQLATWLVLGSIPGFTHGLLQPREVMQNGEYADARLRARAIALHYFNSCEKDFLQYERSARPASKSWAEAQLSVSE